MTYKVVTWDSQHHCTRYHEVADAIDYDDAEQVVKGLHPEQKVLGVTYTPCLLYTSPSPRDVEESRMPSSA